MSLNKLATAISLFSLLILALSATTARAGRPLLTDDPDPVEQGKLELEVGAAFFQDHYCDHFDVPFALTYGLVPNLDMGIGFGGQFECARHPATGFEEGLADLVIGSKWKFASHEKLLLDQALSASLKIPTANADDGWGSGKLDADLTWIAGFQLTEQTTLFWNVGYTWIGRTDADLSDVLHYGMAGTVELTPKLQGVFEAVFETPMQRGRGSGGINGGLRYELNDHLTVDAAVGTRLFGHWPELTATVGFTWRI